MNSTFNRSSMEVFEAVKRRKSVRSYLPKPVPKKILKKILESGRLAPSAGNRQPWFFYVVESKEKREQISRARIYARFLTESPIVIVGCGDQKASPKWCRVDVAIAMQNMVLTATEESIGTCWIGDFDERIVKELLKIPESMRVVALLSLGYPSDKQTFLGKPPKKFKRKSLEEIIRYEE